MDKITKENVYSALIGGAVTLGLAHYSTTAEVDHLIRTLASLG
jgi:selenocysteine lyase/cysteine desulfurase